MGRFERGYARFDVRMTLNRGEMDTMISIFDRDTSELGRYVLSRLMAAKER